MWEETEGSLDVSVAGNIHKKGQFWHERLDASKFVLEVIDHGYRLPFAEACPPFYARKTVVETFGQDTNLVNQRTVIICLLAFSGFMVKHYS